MTARAVLQNLDFDGDRKQYSWPMINIDAANHDAQLTKITALRNAVDDVTTDSVIQYDVVARSVPDLISQPTDPAVQTKVQWLVTYHYDSDANEVRHLSIPCAELDASWTVLSGGETIMDLASTEGAALVAAIEALVTEDDGSGSVTVDKIAFRE